MSAQLFDLSGKTALVTGGGTGLGKQFATMLAKAGARVILTGRRPAPLEESAAAIRASGGIASCLPLDSCNGTAIDSAFAQIRASGGLNILVNNAGTSAGASLLDTSEDQWSSIMDANVKGAWLMARAAASLMIEAGSGGSIINITSVLANVVQKGTSAYSASKAALSHLTRVMALEWAKHGIRVNALEPGYYFTDLSSEYLKSPGGQAMIKRIPQRRLGDPAELEGALLLLASAASSYMTGSIVTVDGGLSLPTI